jgi:hypothetical protein
MGGPAEHGGGTPGRLDLAEDGVHVEAGGGEVKQQDAWSTGQSGAQVVDRPRGPEGVAEAVRRLPDPAGEEQVADVRDDGPRRIGGAHSPTIPPRRAASNGLVGRSIGRPGPDDRDSMAFGSWRPVAARAVGSLRFPAVEPVA